MDLSQKDQRGRSRPSLFQFLRISWRSLRLNTLESVTSRWLLMVRKEKPPGMRLDPNGLISTVVVRWFWRFLEPLIRKKVKPVCWWNGLTSTYRREECWSISNSPSWNDQIITQAELIISIFPLLLRMWNRWNPRSKGIAPHQHDGLLLDLAVVFFFSMFQDGGAL